MAGILSYAMKLDTGAFTGPLKGAGGSMGNFQTSVKSIAGPLAAATAAIAGLAGAFIGLNAIKTGVTNAFNLGGALSDLSARTGATVADLAILEQAYKNNGMAAAQVGPSLNRLQAALTGVSEDGQPTHKVFQTLSLDMEKLKTLSAPEQLASVGAAIRGIADPAARAAAAMGIFGRSGGEMLTLFADASAIPNAMRTIGSQAGLLEKNAAVFDRASDLLGSAGTKMRGFFVGVADKVISGVLPLLEAFDALDLSGLGQQAGDIISTLGEGFSTVFSIFRSESDTSVTGMLADVLTVIQTMTTGFVGTIQWLKSAIGSGDLGALLAGTLKFGAMEGVNWLATLFRAAIQGIGAFFNYTLSQVVTLFTGGFNKAFGNIFSAIPTILGGIGVAIYAKLAGPFKEVAAIFSAGLAKGLDLLKQGISNIPGLNKVFGLEDFKATSFETLLSEMRDSADPESAARIGSEMISEGLSKMSDGLEDIAATSMTNLKNAFAGFSMDKLSVFDTDADKAALAELAKSIDPTAFERMINPAAEVAAKAKAALEAAKKTGESLAKPATSPAAVAPRQVGQSGEKAPRRGLLSAAESMASRFARASGIDKANRSVFGNTDRLAMANNRRAIPLNEAARRMARAGAAADPAQGRRARAAAEDPLLKIVRSIDDRFNRLAVA